MTQYQIRFDQRSKEVMLSALNMVRDSYAAEIIKEASDSLIEQHDELLQLYRGILYARPLEEPAVDAEPTE